MKNTIKFAIAFFAVAITATFANAQTPYQTTGNSEATAGIVNLSVTVPKAADLRTGGLASAVNGAEVTTGSTENDKLIVSLNFTDASPNNSEVSEGSPFMSATVPIRMRSNFAYVVQATRAGNLASGPVEDFRASDVGFGVILAARSGALVSSGSDTAGAFGSDPSSATITNGQPTYSKSLNDIPTGTSGTQIFGGDRISQGGDNTSTNNFNSADLRFSVKPQYYTPGTYTETVKVFILTP